MDMSGTEKNQVIDIRKANTTKRGGDENNFHYNNDYQ